MTGCLSNAGGSTVGRLADLAAIEAGTVLCLRACAMDDRKGSRAANGIGAFLCTEDGQTAYESARQICGLCARHGRRSLICHGMGCASLGADEACLARLVAAASGADREDAMLIAVLMVRADMAPYLVMLAETLGHAIRRLDGHGAPVPEMRMH